MPSREMTLEEWVTRLPWSHRARQEFEALRAAHQERDADARRLDWLDINPNALVMRYKDTGRFMACPVEPGAPKGFGATSRAAIDAAMAADTQTEGEGDG